MAAADRVRLPALRTHALRFVHFPRLYNSAHVPQTLNATQKDAEISTLATKFAISTPCLVHRSYVFSGSRLAHLPRSLGCVAANRLAASFCSGVRCGGVPPPCLIHLPFASAFRWQGVPARVRAPHFMALFARSRASRHRMPLLECSMRRAISLRRSLISLRMARRNRAHEGYAKHA